MQNQWETGTEAAGPAVAERQASERTFKIALPHMTGGDVAAWQQALNAQLAAWRVNYSVETHGDYDIATRDLTATVLFGLGIERANMARGVTPELRAKVRNKDLTAAERFRMGRRAPWRARLRRRHAAGGAVAPPLAKIVSSSWGWHPGVHDGVDLICLPNATIYALCHAKVIDVRTAGWWGKAPSGDVATGDGIVQLECLVDAGPFRRGMHFGYGHAEHPVVREGQVVRAGEPLGRAGLAVAWHVHLMVNAGHTSRGVGDRDPMPFVKYALRH